MELQVLIWDFACVNHPRVLTMFYSEIDKKGPELLNYRPPALSHAWRNSRRAIWDGLDAFTNMIEERTIIYKPLNGTVLLMKEIWDTSYREFTKNECKSIAILHDGDPIASADVKAFRGLERVVLVIGTQTTAFEMSLEMIPDHQRARPGDKLYYLLLRARKLGKELE